MSRFDLLGAVSVGDVAMVAQPQTAPKSKTFWKAAAAGAAVFVAYLLLRTIPTGDDPVEVVLDDHGWDWNVD